MYFSIKDLRTRFNRESNFKSLRIPRYIFIHLIPGWEVSLRSFLTVQSCILMIWWLRCFTVYSPKFLKAWLILPNLWYHWRGVLRCCFFFFFPWQAVVLCLVHVELVCLLPLLPSLSVLLIQLISFPSFQCVLGTSLNVRSEFQKVSQIPPNDRQMIDPPGSKRSSWKHHLSGAPVLAAEVSNTQGAAGSTLCLAALGLHRPVSVLSHQILNLQVLKSPRGFKWQYLSHPLLCSLSDSLKRCLCMLFPLPNPLGIQPCWGTCDTTGNCVLFLAWYWDYQRECCPAHSPLWLYSPKELRSATRALEPGESLFLHPDKALNSFLQWF